MPGTRGDERPQGSLALSKSGQCLSPGKVPILLAPENSNLTIHREEKKNALSLPPPKPSHFGKDFINILRKRVFPLPAGDGLRQAFQKQHVIKIKNPRCHQNQNGNVLYINKHHDEFAQP